MWYRLAAFVLGLFVLGFTAARSLAQPAEGVAGEPWLGSVCVTENADQFALRLATEVAPPPFNADRWHWDGPVQVDPGAPVFQLTGPFFEPLEVPNLLGNPVRALMITYADTDPPGAALGARVPDSMGDVGPNQIIAVTNGFIRVFNLNRAVPSVSAVTGVPWSGIALNAFFPESIRGSATASTGDPQVRFDRLSGRWYVMAITTNVTPNRVVLAWSNVVSESTGITTWSFNFFLNNSTDPFLDYPSLGVDSEALYIGGPMFASNGGEFLNRSMGLVVQKSTLSSSNIRVTAFRGWSINGTATSDMLAPRGVDNDDPRAQERGYFVGTSPNGRLLIRSILNPGSNTPSLGPLQNTGVATVNPPYDEFVPRGSVQNGAPTLPRVMNVADNRVFQASMSTPRIETGARSAVWCAVHSSALVSGVRRNLVRWFEFRPPSNANPNPLVYQGTGSLASNAATNPQHFVFGTVAANGQGHMRLGASLGSAAADSATGSSGYLGIVGAMRLRDDDDNTLRLFSIDLQNNNTPYIPAYDVDPPESFRWGDYSSSQIDPIDNQTFWTFQEMCSPANQWSVWAVQAYAPAPPAVAATTPATLTVGTGPVIVAMTAPVSSAGLEFFDTGGGDGRASRMIVQVLTSAGAVDAAITLGTPDFVSPQRVEIPMTVGAAAATGGRRIRITNPDGQSAESTLGVLTIVNPSSCPRVTVDPTSRVACAGQNTTFTVTATASLTPSYQWRFNGTNLANGTIPGTTTTIAGATTPTMTITNLRAQEAGGYDCVVSLAGCASDTSAVATLGVRVGPVVTPPNPVVTCTGGNASFTVSASGTLGTPVFQWRRDGVDLADGTIPGTTTVVSGATTSALNLQGATPAVANQYSCRVTDSCGATVSAGANLRVVDRPAFVTQPTAVSVCGESDDPVVYSVTVSGSSPFAFRWQRRTLGTVTLAPEQDALGSIAIVSNAQTGVSTLTLRGNRRVPANYFCTVSNDCTPQGIASQSAFLRLGGPAVITQPMLQEVCEGATAEFSVIAASPFAMTYQWTRDGVDLSGATTSTLAIQDAGTQDVGLYACRITDQCSTTHTASVALVVAADLSTPGVSVTATGVIGAGSPSDSLRGAIDDVVVLSVQVSAPPGTVLGTTTFRWLFAGEEIGSDAVIELPALSLVGTGTYTVEVTNACGTVSRNVRISCPDFDENGVVDPDDLADYISAYLGA